MKIRPFSFVSVSLFLALFIPGLSPASAETPTYKVSNTDLESFNFIVGPGDTLKLSNVKLCMKPEGEKCTIQIAKGGKLDAGNSDFGSRVTIYHSGSYSDSISLSNANMLGNIVPTSPLPQHQAGASNFTNEPLEVKKISNSKIESTEIIARSGELLRLSNTKVCLKPSGPSCSVIIEPGASIRASNTDFGERVTIYLSDNISTPIQFSNVQMNGRIVPGQGGASKRSLKTSSLPQPVSPPAQELVEDNKRIVAEVRKRGLKVRSNDRGVVINLPEVYFEFDKATLTGSASQNVSKIADILGSARQRYITIEGHTDSKGADSYNKDLSFRRARSVSTALEKQGMSGQRLAVRGFGEARPVASNQTDMGRAKNRRVEVIVENNVEVFKANQKAQSSSSSLTEQLNKQQGNFSSPTPRNSLRKSTQDNSNVSITKRGVRSGGVVVNGGQVKTPDVVVNGGNVRAPGVEISPESVKAPGVVIDQTGVQAPGVSITKDRITAPGVDINLN